MLCHDIAIAERDVVLRRFPYPASHRTGRVRMFAPLTNRTQLYHSRLRHSYHAPMNRNSLTRRYQTSD